MNEENYSKRNPFMDDPAPGYIEKYEGLTGEELPRKGNEIKNAICLSLPEFWAIKKSDGVRGWGSVVNNPCVVYRSFDGRRIEEYNSEGLPTIYIEAQS